MLTRSTAPQFSIPTPRRRFSLATGARIASKARRFKTRSATIQLIINAGVRGDHYRLMVDEQVVSLRLTEAWQVPGAGLVLRASYERAFQTPALASVDSRRGTLTVRRTLAGSI